MQYIVSQMENYSAEGRDRHWKEKGKKKPKQNQTKYKTKPQIYGSKPSAGASSPFTTV